MALKIGELVAQLRMDDASFHVGIANADRAVARLDGNLKRASVSMGQSAASGIGGPFQIVHRNFDRAAEGASKMVPALNRAQNALTALAIGASGVNPHLAKLSIALSSLSIGGPVMLGAIAGVTALTLWWNRGKEAANNYAKAVDGAVDRIKSLGAAAGFGESFPLQQDVSNARGRQEFLREQIQERGTKLAETAARQGVSGQLSGVVAGDEKLRAWLTEFRQLNDGIAEAERMLDEPNFASRLQDLAGQLLSGLPDAEKLLPKEPGKGASADFLRTLFFQGQGGKPAPKSAISTIEAPAFDFLAKQGKGDLVGSSFVGPKEPTKPEKSFVEKAKEKGKGVLDSLVSGLGGIIKALNPFKFIVEAVQRAFGDFLVNMTPIVELLAAALMPILKALFPIIKAMIISFTYATQVILTLAEGLAKALGALIYGLGVLVKLIPGDRGLGEKIKSFGKDLINLGNGFGEARSEMGKARDEIKKLEWKDVADESQDAAKGLRAMNIELVNAPRTLRAALLRFQVLQRRRDEDDRGEPKPKEPEPKEPEPKEPEPKCPPGYQWDPTEKRCVRKVPEEPRPPEDEPRQPREPGDEKPKFPRFPREPRDPDPRREPRDPGSLPGDPDRDRRRPYFPEPLSLAPWEAVGFRPHHFGAETNGPATAQSQSTVMNINIGEGAIVVEAGQRSGEEIARAVIDEVQRLTVRGGPAFPRRVL